MSNANKHAWQQLLETGALVEFRILDTHTELSPDKENIAVRADLVFTGDDEDMDPADVVEWAAFGFLFVLASLSFNDARPRGYSEADFMPTDEFTVNDFFECLTYRQDGLHLRVRVVTIIDVVFCTLFDGLSVRAVA